MADEEKPLPSGAGPDGASEETPLASTAPAGESETPAPRPRPARPPPQPVKLSTMAYLFLGFLGLWMLIDATARNQIAGLLGIGPTQGGPLYWAIGFDSKYLLVTMMLAGAIEMLITALAYNFTTDWIKAARVQKWSAAFRKVQMEALRSGKKDRIEALKPHQERLTRLSGEVTIAQFKGMAITYFLLILIYTWVGLVIAGAAATAQVINLGGSSINLMGHVGSLPIPWWFLIFSLYTVPFSLVFRRVLKNLWLRRYAAEHHIGPGGPTSDAVGSSV
jgi:uncharacterized membrane protein (DUF106 family)